ncbi:MAG: hypothetical protein QXQ39_07485 [Conexivisphaerales archaeon]
MTEEEQELYALIMESLYYSLHPVETEKMESYVDQFIWQAAEDLAAVEEVKKSYTSLKGWGEAQVAEELSFRAKYIDDMVRSGSYKYADVTLAIQKFYRERYNSMVRNEAKES